MGKIRGDLVILGVLLVLLFGVRMAISHETQSLSYDSYLTVRDVEHIQKTWLPLRDDTLSITGAKRIGNPFFDYLLAFAVAITPLAYKLLPNLCMVLLLIPLYFLTLRFTQSRVASMMTIILAGSGPIVFSSYLNTPSSAPFGLLLLLLILALLHDPDKYIFHIIILSIILTFTSPIIFILVIALLVIMILLRLEGFGVDRRVNEFFFFTLMLSLWFYVIVYKQALFTEGLNVLWQNLPTEVALQSFRTATFLDAITGLGVVTFLLGAIGMYGALFENRDKSSYTIVGAIIAVLVTLVLRIVSLQIGFLLLTILLAAMAGYGLAISFEYLQRTRFPSAAYFFSAFVFFLFLFSAVLPALVNARVAMQDAPSQADIATYQLLGNRLPKNAIVLTTVKEGAAVQYFSGHTTLTDSDFLLVQNGDELVNDIDSVYTSRFSITVVGKVEKLGVTHVLFSSLAKREYSRDKIYAEGSCVQSEIVGDSLIYYVECLEAQQ